MNIPARKRARSGPLAEKVIYAALSILRDNGKEMSLGELMNKVEQQTNFDEWEKARYEKTGYIRWESILRFFSADCGKAGYLKKKRQGIWHITPEGEDALKMSPEELFLKATSAYSSWKEKKIVRLVKPQISRKGNYHQLQLH